MTLTLSCYKLKRPKDYSKWAQRVVLVKTKKKTHKNPKPTTEKQQKETKLKKKISTMG